MHNLTVFKVHFGRLTLKMYDKGERVLRIELIVNNTAELRCGKGIDKLPGILERSQQMIVEFLAVVQAAHLSFLPAEQLDSLAMPTYRGQQRLAGVDIQKPRLRAVAQALIALAPQPDGFTAEQLAARVRSQQGRTMAKYHTRKAAYDLRKFRGKNWCNALLTADVTEFDGQVSERSLHCLSREKKSLNPYSPESVAQSAAVLPKMSTL